MTKLFEFLSFSPGLFWFLILLFPKNNRAMLAVDFFLFVLSGIFVFLTLPAVPALLPVIAKPTLASIQAFLATEKGTVGAWNHMILSDLWIGRWVAFDSQNDRYPLVIRLIFIPLIIFFGPMGLFFYILYRTGVQRRLSLTH